MTKKITLISLMIIFAHQTVRASGFSIYEQGARATAMAGAFIARADDPTAVFYNPAGIRTLQGWQISLGTTLIQTEFAFTGPQNIDSRKYTRARKGRFAPSHFYATYAVNSWLSAGFGFYSLFGLASDWGSPDNPWVGRQLATKTDLKTFYYNPMLAVNWKGVSFGLGLDVVQSSVVMEKSVYFTPRSMFGESRLDGDATGLGFNLGIQARLFNKLRLGATYRSNVDLNFKDGQASFDFPASGNAVIDAEIAQYFPASTGGSARLKLPAMIGLGVAFDFTENLNFELDYLLTGWSSYDKLEVTFAEAVAGQKKSTSLRNYEDSHSIRFGMEYRARPYLALRAGYLYDRHAVPGAYVEPSLPEGDRHNYTLGFGLNMRSITLDGAWHILLQDDREVTNSIHNFNGQYTGLANLYSLSLGYHF